MVSKKDIVADVDLLKENIETSFKNVGTDIDYLLQLSEGTAHQFNELRDELATNGVVRDLRKLEKNFAELQRHTASLIMEHDRQLEDLKRNGVATAINKLNKEVFAEKKSDTPSGFLGAIYAMSGVEPNEEVTLAGKVDAIIEHLGLDISVKPKEIVEAKVEVKKKPAPKKKGRR